MCWIAFLLVAVISGNGSLIEPAMPAGSVLLTDPQGPVRWGERAGWVAEEYFDDPHSIALCKAIESGDPDAVRQVVSDGADANGKGKFGMTPLLWCLPDPDCQILAVLLSSGADPNAVIVSDFELPTLLASGMNFTYIAAAHLSSETLELALMHGGDPNSVDGRYTEPSLAAAAGRPESLPWIKVLVEYGARTNAMSGAVNGIPVVQVAFARRDFETVLFLLRHGASPETKTAVTRTLVDKVCEFRVGEEHVDYANVIEYDEVYQQIRRMAPDAVDAAEARVRAQPAKRGRRLQSQATRGGSRHHDAFARSSDDGSDTFVNRLATTVSLINERSSSPGAVDDDETPREASDLSDVAAQQSSPLQRAYATGDLEAVLVLLQQGADPFVFDSSGFKLAHRVATETRTDDNGEPLVAKASYREIRMLLLEQGESLAKAQREVEVFERMKAENGADDAAAFRFRLAEQETQLRALVRVCKAQRRAAVGQSRE